MRFTGRQSLVRLRSSKFRLAAAFLGALGVSVGVQAQQAPQVLPFTMSTFAGSHVAYTAGAACANGIGVALDTQGDGCLASSVSVGIDPHDVRVDARGNVFYIDNASVGLIHKINGETGLQTIYAGSPSSSKTCSGAVDTYGDGCPANDGAANNTSTNPYTSSKFKSQRGLGIAANGDLFSAGYNDYEVHKISASTGLMTLVAGTGTAATVANTGTATSTTIGSSRGVGVDAAGNVYIADTGINIIQEVTTAGQLVSVTMPNPSATKSVTSGVPANTAYVSAPEDVQVNVNGDIIIADTGNSVIRAIYGGKSTNFFGIASPVAGYIYTIAGGGTGIYTPGSGLVATAVPGTSITLSGARKFSVDLQGNLYLGDTVNGYIWFIDAATGYIRLIVGNYGATPGSSAIGCAANPTVAGTYNYGDGCPGVQATLYGNSTNASIGASADNQGNLYITDPQFANAANSRIRKLLSGLNFPATNLNSTATQTVDVHFGVGDTIANVTSGGDFSIATPSCTTNADNTSDCLLTVSFTPKSAVYQTLPIVITSSLGGKTTVLLTGIGNASTLAVDPGALTLATSNTSNPQGAAYDSAGNVYVADTGNNRILRITKAGVVSTYAGTGTSGYSGDNGLATAATFKAPAGLVFGTNGLLYVADTGNNVIRQINPASGIITTYAGGASTVCSMASDTLGDNCPATQATFSKPSNLAADKLGQLYVVDSGNNLVRQISVLGYVTTFAGGGSSGCAFSASCAALSTTFTNPLGVAYDQTGNYLVLADTASHVVRKIYLGSAITVTGTNTGSAVINPVTLVAGNGTPGSTVDNSGIATNSQLSSPAGVAVDAAENVYIADTGNDAIRAVNATGTITTIAGIVGTPGAGAPGTATDTLLNSPVGITVLPYGQLYITDSGNGRVLADNRTNAGYNFGRVSPNVTSSLQTFTELNVGNLATAVGSTPVTGSGNTSQFALTPVSGSAGCSAGTSLKAGSSCVLNGTFTPTAVGTYAATYTLNASSTLSITPTIALTGTGAILTTTTPVVMQTVPATGNVQYGASLTLKVTVTPSSCNTAAPSCFPTGTARIIVDGVSGSPQTLDGTASASQVFTGLSVGTHTVSCTYSGDTYYAAGSCANVNITVAPATTTSVLTVASGNNSPQFTTAVLNVKVTSSTVGVPTGSVIFTVSPAVTLYGQTTASNTLATVPLSNGSASLTLQQILSGSGAITSDNTLPPGTYQLACTYTPTSGTTSNFATSTCTPVTFTVIAQASSLTLVARGCALENLAPTITGVPVQNGYCQPAGESLVGTVPAGKTAQGSTTDVSIFVTPSNTLSGPLSLSCAGLPKYSTCTFAPSIYTLSATTAYVAPIGIDVTLWTDIKDASLTMPSIGNRGSSPIEFASMATRFGWPLALLGFAGLLLGRRRFRNLRALAVLMLLVGSSLVATGCAGPGDYTPNLTPAGTYPITITVSAGNLKATTVVDFVVTSPGIPGLQ